MNKEVHLRGRRMLQGNQTSRLPLSAKRNNSFVDSAKKHMPLDKSKEKMSPSLNRSDKNLNKTNKNIPNVRRSARKRIAPLEHWRCERAHYYIDNGLVHFIDIDPGNNEDDRSRKEIAARQEKYRKKIENIKKKPVKPPKVQINDVILKKKVRVPLLKKFHLFPWMGEPNEEAPYCIKKVIQTVNSFFGFIEIKAGKIKPLQYLRSEDIYFCLLQGKLKAVIGGKETIIEEKDTLIIPKSVPYILKNIGQRKALVSFTIGQFKYMDSAHD